MSQVTEINSYKLESRIQELEYKVKRLENESEEKKEKKYKRTRVIMWIMMISLLPLYLWSLVLQDKWRYEDTQKQIEAAIQNKDVNHETSSR